MIYRTNKHVTDVDAENLKAIVQKWLRLRRLGWDVLSRSVNKTEKCMFLLYKFIRNYYISLILYSIFKYNLIRKCSPRARVWYARAKLEGSLFLSLRNTYKCKDFILWIIEAFEASS